LTFRASKKHKSQESTKISTNALKLASRFQHFLNTGEGSKKDLKEVDDRFNSQISQQGDKILTLLDQLREIVPKEASKALLDQACETWAKWLSGLDTKEILGYAHLKVSEAASDGTQGILLESVLEAETHLFQMLFAIKAALSSALKDPDSTNERACADLSLGINEIMETYQTRQRILGKVIGPRR
jgi:hypothetical protein